MYSGTLTPDEGSIKIDGTEVIGADEHIRDGMHSKGNVVSGRSAF